MSTLEEKNKYSLEEYLTREDQSEYKSEFYNGEIFDMSGGTIPHGLIGANVSRELGVALLDKDCSVFGGEVKVRIELANAFVYPDAMVVCGKVERFGDRPDAVTNPVIVVEVLSDSTGSWDRGGKFRQYELLPSVREYVLVEQKEAQIDVFRRDEKGFWLLERYAGLDASVEFKSVGVSIPCKRIYHRVEF